MHSYKPLSCLDNSTIDKVAFTMFTLLAELIFSPVIEYLFGFRDTRTPFLNHFTMSCGVPVMEHKRDMEPSFLSLATVSDVEITLAGTEKK